MAVAAIKDIPVTYRVETKAWMQDFFSDEPQTYERHQMDALFMRHHDEVARFKHMRKLDPDWPQYRKLAETNRIFMVVARQGQRIVGYIVIFMTRNLHDRTLVHSMDDLYYIEPTERGAGIGAEMIAFAEKEAARRGSKFQTLRAKVGSPAARFLERVGYVPYEIILAKELKP